MQYQNRNRKESNVKRIFRKKEKKPHSINICHKYWRNFVVYSCQSASLTRKTSSVPFSQVQRAVHFVFTWDVFSQISTIYCLTATWLYFNRNATANYRQPGLFILKCSLPLGFKLKWRILCLMRVLLYVCSSEAILASLVETFSRKGEGFMVQCLCSLSLCVLRRRHAFLNWW